MKKLLLILLITPIVSFGQQQKINKLEKQLEDIENRLDEHHKQFKNGTKTLSVGVLVTTIGALVSTPVVVIIGGAISLTGQIIQIDSHKWFKDENFTDKFYRKELKKYNKLYDSGKISKESYNKSVKILKEKK